MWARSDPPLARPPSPHRLNIICPTLLFLRHFFLLQPLEPIAKCQKLIIKRKSKANRPTSVARWGKNDGKRQSTLSLSMPSKRN